MERPESELPELGEDGYYRGEAAAPRLKTFESMMNGAGEEMAFRSSAGVNYTFEDDPHNGDLLIRSYQDVYQILERNQDMLTANNGYSPDKTFRRVASVPSSIRNKVLIETGGQVDLWRPETDEKYYKKFMNSSDNQKFRTAEGRL